MIDAGVALTPDATAPRSAAPADVACSHCSLPVPRGLLEPGAARQFCCAGCRMVFDTIHACGLERYYDLREEAPAATDASRATDRRYEHLDDPAFQASFVERTPDGQASARFYLEGVHCAACVWLVERLPRVLPGVREARVDIGRRVARITWDPGVVALSRIARQLDRLGYPPHPDRGAVMDDVRRREDRRHLVRIGIAGACAGNVMLIAFALYGGMLNGIAAEHELLLRGASLGLTLIALLGPGRTFLTRAWSSLRTRLMHMDVPIAIALVAGTAWGAVNTFRGAGEVYFESLTAVIFLLLVGRWIQHRRQRSAQDAVELLYAVTPATALLVDEATGVEREAAIESVAAGATVRVRAGDAVPADGLVVRGASDLDRSLLTGESRPCAIFAGDRVHAGAVNLSSPIDVRVEETGSRTRAGRLMLMVEELARRKPPIVRAVDRFAHRFVLIVLVAAAGTALLWSWIAPERAVENAIALLIVTCPCALGLATPLAVMAAIGRAAAGGILIKGGDAIERLAAPGVVLLDKTGTLTRGAMRLVEWSGDDAVLALVAGLERGVNHPIAQAFTDALALDSDHAPPAESVFTHGGGVEGVVDGRRVVVGSSRFVRGRATSETSAVAGAEARCTDEALSPVLVAVDGTIIAVAGFGDPVLEDARVSVARLRELGWDVRVLSGDHPAVVDAVARQVGIDSEQCEGGASPERKAAVVDDLRRTHETVVMVGDGVNDAAALSAAHVGIAVHGGAEASLAAADVYLRRPGLAPVVHVLEGARRSVAVIHRNLYVSLFYNAVAASLAVAGVINPLIAAVLMPISSLTVVTLSYRSRTF